MGAVEDASTGSGAGAGETRTVWNSIGGSGVKKVTRSGREYLEFPIVPIREMVLNYPEQDRREYVSAERVEESIPRWTDIPLRPTHPKRNPDGSATARNADGYMLDEVGRTYDPEPVGDAAVRTWGRVDVRKARELGGAHAEMIDRLEAGETLPVSPGYDTNGDRFVAGIHDGEQYDLEQGELDPDHIAIIVGEERARAGIDDGVGAPKFNYIGEEADLSSAIESNSSAATEPGSDGGDGEYPLRKKVIDSVLGILSLDTPAIESNASGGERTPSDADSTGGEESAETAGESAEITTARVVGTAQSAASESGHAPDSDDNTVSRNNGNGTGTLIDTLSRNDDNRSTPNNPGESRADGSDSGIRLPDGSNNDQTGGAETRTGGATRTRANTVAGRAGRDGDRGGKQSGAVGNSTMEYDEIVAALKGEDDDESPVPFSADEIEAMSEDQVTALHEQFVQQVATDGGTDAGDGDADGDAGDATDTETRQNASGNRVEKLEQRIGELESERSRAAKEPGATFLKENTDLGDEAIQSMDADTVETLAQDYSGQSGSGSGGQSGSGIQTGVGERTRAVMNQQGQQGVQQPGQQPNMTGAPGGGYTRQNTMSESDGPDEPLSGRDAYEARNAESGGDA